MVVDSYDAVSRNKPYIIPEYSLTGDLLAYLTRITVPLPEQQLYLLPCPSSYGR